MEESRESEKQYEKKRVRRFQPQRRDRWYWLGFDETTNIVFCELFFHCNTKEGKCGTAFSDCLRKIRHQIPTEKRTEKEKGEGTQIPVVGIAVIFHTTYFKSESRHRSIFLGSEWIFVKVFQFQRFTGSPWLYK
ncbi:uncharacterized protein V6R79_009177 [Siganus canaliculatus]